MTFKNGYRVWDDEFERLYWTHDEIQAGNTLAEKICEIIDAEHNGKISHDEAMIRHLVLEPDLAQTMLDDAEDDEDKIRKIHHYIKEANRRRKEATYWGALISHAEDTARHGCNIEHTLALLNTAASIIKNAVPATI